MNKDMQQMIAAKENTRFPVEIRPDEPLKQLNQKNRKNYHRLMWINILLACFGATWFSCQYFLMSQPKDYAPDWHGAQWVQAADSRTPVTYFRYVIHLDSSPDGAFVTIAANQTFLLYVNGS